MKKSERYIVIWLFAGCFLIYAMVLIGGLTRLTHSGLSMVEWSPVGSFPPMNDVAWNEQFEKYKLSPEFKLINNSFSLNDFKGIFWFEYIHRFIGRLIGIIFLVPFLYFLIAKKFPKGFVRKMFVLLLVGSSQGLLGWFMVKSGLVKNPYVSHYRLAAHLATAFTAFGFTFWYALDLLYPVAEYYDNPKLNRLTRLLLVFVGIQIIYGGFVAGLKAGYLYPTFPKMGNDWIPKEVTALDPVWKNFTEGPIGLQFIHRCIAYLVFAIVLIIFFKSKKVSLSQLQKKLIDRLMILVALQFILGVVTIVYSVPVAIAVAHQTGAFFLFSIILFLLHRTTKERIEMLQ